MSPATRRRSSTVERRPRGRSRLGSSPFGPLAPLVALTGLALVLAACSGATAASTAPSADPSTAAPVAVASADSSATPAPAFPLRLTDDEGGTVTLAAAPAKVVSLTPAVTETLFALGAGRLIVGNDDYDDFPPDATTITHVASYTGVDVEKIVALAPDLVIAGGNGLTPPDAVAKLRSLGLQVLVVYANDVDEVLSDIDLVGEAVGRSAQATAITSQMRAGIDAIAAATAALPKPRVFYEIDATKEIYGPADESFVASMIALAGATPITTGSTTVFSIPLEKLVAADPEVIVLGDSVYGTTVDDVLARSGWTSMTAVKQKAIRPVDDTIVTRPGPRLVEGLRALALAIHGEVELPAAPSFSPTGE